MRIHDFELCDRGDHREVAARVDDFRLWYRVPSTFELSSRADPFVAAALLPAMAKGETLRVHSGLRVSPGLLRNLATLQEIHHCWNPALRIVDVEATTEARAWGREGAISFFSGGVDSMYTLLKRRSEVSHVVYIQGFDFQVDDASFAQALHRNASFVAEFGKTVIPVRTNTNAFGYHHNLSVLLTQGSVLASVALLLGFRRAYISSAFSYGQLVPLGSHPLTDPLWSTEGVEIVHDGAEVRRVDKVRRIATEPRMLANLMVCARGVGSNCGECEKCLRTMIPLHLLGVSTPAFPPLPPPSRIRKMHVANDIEMAFLKENWDLAQETGDDSLGRALGSCIRRHERVRLLKDVDRVLLGGRVKRAYRRARKDDPGTRRISMVPARD